MDNLTMMVTALDVACMTEDRSPTEQRALLDLALKLDKERGAFVSTNKAVHPPTLVAHVEATYDPSFGRTVSLTSGQREQYNRLLAAWSRCTVCGWAMGMHYADGECPHPGDYFILYGGDALRAWRAARSEATA